METETAKMISYAITAIGGMVWLSGLWFLLRISRKKPNPPANTDDLSTWTQDKKPSPYFGVCELEGKPAELAAKAASALAKSNREPLGFTKVTEQTHDRVTFERFHTLGSGLRRGYIYFQATGSNRTRITYYLGTSARPWLLWAGFVFSALGLAALVTGFWIIQTYVITHPNPAIRWQVLQGLQAVHFLWPPFLFGGIYLKTLRISRDHIDALVHNLTYHSD